MDQASQSENGQSKEDLIKWRIKVRKFQREAIYKCLPEKLPADLVGRNVNDKVWDVIYFIALNGMSSTPLTASDIYLGTELAKRTVIRIINRLEALNVVQKRPDEDDRRVIRIGFTPAFAKVLDRHLEDCIAG
ncbi:MAG: MarR family transcriptional regulator [Rhodospirillales bacterium]|nr:MarR family transcriptional regulator [Alphaproteobacteria bacterium]MBL6948096.1 MarR family transcriptional regulator [Rhodospirillales bacterium]